MPYAEGRIIHDADSHVVETPDWLVPWADPAVREHMHPLYLSRVKPGEETFIDELRRRHADPPERPQAEADIMPRKNWSALGSFVKEDRPRALDLLGFASQLVFNTFLSQYLCQTEHQTDVDFAYGLARAHNRAMVDFCAVDRRLLTVGYVPLADFARARALAAEAVPMGCQAPRVPAPARAPPRAGPPRPVPGRGQRRGGGPPNRLPRRGGRPAAPAPLLRQRPPAGAGLPRRRRELPLRGLHGDPVPAHADARHHDLRRHLRPLPPPQGGRHQAGRDLAAELDAAARGRVRGVRQGRGAPPQARAQAERVRPAADPRHPLPH